MIILKLGGSAITEKSGYMKANKKAIALLAKSVASARKKGMGELIIVHGAGSFGHAPVLKYGLNDGVKTQQQKKGCRITQKACAKLSSFVISALKKAGVAAVSLPPHKLIVSKGKRIRSFNAVPINSALKANKIPVLYGDMVPDSKLGFSVLSGDQIVAYLGKKAEKIVLASNVDGVMAWGRVVPKITKANFADVACHLCGSSSPDVTGGMAGKIREIMRTGTPAYVVNAKKPERLLALLLGKKTVCTSIN